MSPRLKKNIILFVGHAPKSTAEALLNIKKRSNKKYRTAILYPVKPGMNGKREREELAKIVDHLITCNVDSPRSITEALKPFEDQICAVTTRSESNIPAFSKVIPYLPYIPTPSVESLEWSTNKIEMRRRFWAYDKSITPAYSVVKDTKKETIKKIIKKVGFPLVIKPSGLAESLLVNVGYHAEELEETLKKVFKKIEKIHKETKGRGTPQVLVEQFMEGDMYTVDAYINRKGQVSFCPMVSVKTGKQIGFDDFFGYMRITPTKLSPENLESAHWVSRKALHALRLRNSTAHIELLKTEDGWKVIEIGPRIGGFRVLMYKLSYGFDHFENDIFNRIPKKVSVTKKPLGYTAVMQFFGQKEGEISNLTGIKKAKELKSMHSIKVNKKVGDRAVFAKHGGRSVINVTLFNKERSKLLADIRRLEQMIKIEVK